MLRKTYRFLRREVLHYLIPMSPARLFAEARMGVEVVGFFRSATGIGESARLCALQLKRCGYDVRCRSVEKVFRKPNEIAWDFHDGCEESEVGCRIFHLNPPMLPPAIFAMGLRNYRRTFNIAYWAWELERVPVEWRRAMRYVSAIFTPSTFVSRALGHETNKPIITVPHPVSAPSFSGGVREQLGIPAESFLVSSVFSFASGVERKNPCALIKAFGQACGKNPSARLVLKTSHGGSSYEKADLLAETQLYRNIILIDEVWPSEKVAGLIKDSDLYASLHRSEGFGLTIAEAMLLGTPTMSSDWSGNTDFCSLENSYPIRVDLIPVRSSNPEYGSLSDLRWADADTNHAAEVLTAIAADRGAASGKAAACLTGTNAYFMQHYYDIAIKQLAAAQDASLRALDSDTRSATA